MDPNATLSRLREVLSLWEQWGSLELNADATLDEVVDLFFAIDEWLSTGGFRPDDWS